MKILIRLCLLCSVAFMGISAVPPSLMTRTMSVNYIGKQGSKHCYAVNLSTSAPVYSIKIGSRTCNNTTSCNATVCFQGGYDDTFEEIKCFTKATANSSTVKDGCIITIGPG